MGIQFKVDGVVQPSGESGHIEPQEVPMTDEMTKRLWEVINENTELRQQVTMLNAKLDMVKDILNR